MSCPILSTSMATAVDVYPRLLRGMISAIVVSLVAMSSHGAWSQSTRTIKFVVPYVAGGATDTLARLLADGINRAQGTPIVVENRPGAGTIIGTEAVSRAAPDGKTLLFNTNPFVINPHLRKLTYDPLTSFEPICYLVNVPLLIVVNSASPYGTLADLINAARAKPGAVTLASVGPDSSSQIAIEMLKRAAGVNILFVPYPGFAPAVTALLGEHVASAISDLSTVAEQLRAGKLRALATASGTRIEPLPEVPTVAESGYKDYELDAWTGVVAPAKTPQETVSQLAAWFAAAMQTSEIKPKLIAQGLFPVGLCGRDFGAFIRKQYNEYGRVIRESTIQAE